MWLILSIKNTCIIRNAASSIYILPEKPIITNEQKTSNTVSGVLYIIINRY